MIDEESEESRELAPALKLNATVTTRGRVPRAPRAQTAKERDQRIKEIREASVAENTKLSYSSDLRQYQRTKRILPANEADLVSYIADFEGILKPDTIAHHLQAISKWHREMAHRDPTESEEVKSVLAGVRRRNPSQAKQARALTKQIMIMLDEDLKEKAAKLNDAEPRDRGAALSALRDNALLQLGFFGGFRRSELVAVHVEHITWQGDGILVRLPRSKTDQEGKGRNKAIAKGKKELCPVTSLQSWLQRSGITSGPIFRPFTKAAGIRDQALSDRSVANILVARLSEIGVEDADQYSGHSLRRGLATSAYQAGADIESIKNQGGWKTDASVSRYIDEAKLYNASAAILDSSDDLDVKREDPT